MKKVLLTKLLIGARATISMSEGRRVVVMGAVKLNGETIRDISQEVEIQVGDLIEVGKKRQIIVTAQMLEDL